MYRHAVEIVDLEDCQLVTLYLPHLPGPYVREVIRLPKEPAIEFGDKFNSLKVEEGESKMYCVERGEGKKIELPDGSEFSECEGFWVTVLR